MMTDKRTSYAIGLSDSASEVPEQLKEIMRENSRALEEDKFPDIRVTPEMIEAGSRVIRGQLDNEPSWGECELIAERVLRVGFRMLSAVTK